jgi:hypothetical protein
MKFQTLDGMLKMKTATKFMIAAAGIAAGSVFDGPSSYPFGDAPWCAVTSLVGATCIGIANIAPSKRVCRT